MNDKNRERRFVLYEANMERFKEIYDEELAKYEDESPLYTAVLDHPDIRAFVYEVCKRLHGEGEKEEEKPTEEAHWSSKEMVVDPTRCVCGKPYGHLSACAPMETNQPSHTPTRQEWEEWVEKVWMLLVDLNLTWNIRKRITDLLREMPIVPKG